MQCIVQDHTDTMQRDTDAGFLAWAVDNMTTEEWVSFTGELFLKH